MSTNVVDVAIHQAGFLVARDPKCNAFRWVRHNATGHVVDRSRGQFPSREEARLDMHIEAASAAMGSLNLSDAAWDGLDESEQASLIANVYAPPRRRARCA